MLDRSRKQILPATADSMTASELEQWAVKLDLDRVQLVDKMREARKVVSDTEWAYEDAKREAEIAAQEGAEHGARGKPTKDTIKAFMDAYEPLKVAKRAKGDAVNELEYLRGMNFAHGDAQKSLNAMLYKKAAQMMKDAAMAAVSNKPDEQWDGKW